MTPGTPMRLARVSLFWPFVALLVVTAVASFALVLLWSRMWGLILDAREAARKRRLLLDMHELFFMMAHDPRPPGAPAAAADDEPKRGMDA